MERCAVVAARKKAYSYQTFCEMFSEAGERTGATKRLSHEPGQKAYTSTGGSTPRTTRTA